MTDATIFGQDNTPTEAPQTTESSTLAALVGETQKYKTPEELAKAYTNADAFIQQLKEENRKLREQAAKAATIDDVLNRLSEKQKEPEDDIPTEQGFNPDLVPELVEKVLEKRETQKQRDSNIKKADAIMKEKFGDKAKEVFASIAVTPEIQQSLLQIAAVDPDKFVALFAGVQQPSQKGNNMDSGSVSTASVGITSNRENTPGTREYYNKLRREEPNKYWSQKVQLEIQQAGIKNPQLYFGN